MVQPKESLAQSCVLFTKHVDKSLSYSIVQISDSCTVFAALFGQSNLTFKICPSDNHKNSSKICPACTLHPVPRVLSCILLNTDSIALISDSTKHVQYLVLVRSVL